jgi:hypothetical protein
MDGVKGIGGWVAVVMVSLTLTLVVLVVEKQLRAPTEGRFRVPGTVEKSAATTKPKGIVLAVDPGLIATEQYPPADRTPVLRAGQQQDIADLLASPPEPATQVVLRAPMMDDSETLTIASSSLEIDQLMDAIDRAFESPMQTVSVTVAETKGAVAENGPDNQRIPLLPGISSNDQRFPVPRNVIRELADLQSALAPAEGKYVSRSLSMDDNNVDGKAFVKSYTISNKAASQLSQWIDAVGSLVQKLNSDLDAFESIETLESLQTLVQHGNGIAESLTDGELASRVTRVGYSINRRIAVWRAVSECLNRQSNPEPIDVGSNSASRNQIPETIAAVERKLYTSGDPVGWRNYLMIDELKLWSKQGNDVWEAGNRIAANVLSRLRWERLTDPQRKFLDQPEFENLANQLHVWASRPVDYRQLLNDLELLEEDPINRVRNTLAGNVQVLRLADQPHQKLVAEALNDHYRNANIRVAIASKLIERMLPRDSYQSRPVNQKILGANTSGDSIIRTSLSLKLHPDEDAWNVELGVQGDVYSNTRSSKGPAIFHNSSAAQVATQRTIRLDTNGYRVSNSGTAVESEQTLRKMSTDLDGLPVIGDFFRLIVREQFDQQRGIAKRIMHRILAEQTDQELDKQLQEKLKNAEVQLQRQLVGPLEALNLNPMVVALSTTEDRLLIRYRVANQNQMAAHTARPRAPSDSLMSMQVHQSAFNNTLSQMELGEKTWNLVELFEKFGKAFGQKNWKAPAEVPTDVFIRFAPSRPITIEMVDNQLTLTLRIAELSQGDHKFERFMVKSTYIPVADGLKAGLVRDGVISIDGARLGISQRLPLRAIFAKVFVSRPEIPLISESLANDKRAEGLAVSQIEVRDGWLAVAIADGTSPHVSEVANRSRQTQLR